MAAMAAILDFRAIFDLQVTLMVQVWSQLAFRLGEKASRILRAMAAILDFRSARF